MKCETAFRENTVIQITLTMMILEGKKSLNKQTIVFLAVWFALQTGTFGKFLHFLFKLIWKLTKRIKIKVEDIELPWPSWSQQNLHVLAEEKTRDLPP